MVRQRHWIAGRDAKGEPERVLNVTDDLRRAHQLGIDRIVGGCEDVTVRDWHTQTQWTPVPWTEHLDDESDVTA